MNTEYNNHDGLSNPLVEKSSVNNKPKRTRITFTNSQLMDLEKEFRKNMYLHRTGRLQIAKRLSLNETQVRTWFQNRRMREKKISQDSPEEKYSTKQIVSETNNSKNIQKGVVESHMFYNQSYVQNPSNNYVYGINETNFAGYAEHKASDLSTILGHREQGPRSSFLTYHNYYMDTKFQNVKHYLESSARAWYNEEQKNQTKSHNQKS